ncbi:hypothetical protein N431DRAFT_352760 [Stipitochalara longipes BDJ]|nr:hypothetical protein N431DRAFT_352760 [Stipitochalara longipes BDJ]
MPRTRTNIPPLAGWWKCCNETCNREVNSELWGSTCPDCNHQKCGSCEENIARNRRFGRRIRCENTEHTRQTRQPTIADYTRVDKSKWWICCQDRREVNFDIWGDYCPDCSHPKCSYCDRAR